jgi:DinB superfamily
MKRIKGLALLLAAFTLAGFAPSAFAQGGAPAPATQVTTTPAPNPVSDQLRTLVPRYAKNMVGAAEAMPADKYDYKPTKEQITFAHLVLHVAQSNNILCSKLTTTPPPQSDAKDTDGKDKLVAAIKASFDYCSEVLAKADDSGLGTSVSLSATRTMTKAGVMITLAGDWYDHYSAQAGYLRLNGILPPSAQPATPPKM